jgi:hypothetical protein
MDTAVSLSPASRPALGSIKPHIQWTLWVLFPADNQQGHEVDHAPPSSAEIKKAWSYTSALQIVL